MGVMELEKEMPINGYTNSKRNVYSLNFADDQVLAQDHDDV